MHPHRLAELRHRGKERLELWPVERLAVDVGVDLHADGAEVFDRALGLAHPAVGREQRRLGDEAREAVRVFGDDLGEAVVNKPDHILELLGFVHALGRRHRVGEDLRVVVEHIDDPEALIEIMNARDFAHPLADVLMVTGEHLGEIFLGDEMRVRVDAHGSSPAGTSGTLEAAAALYAPNKVRRARRTRKGETAETPARGRLLRVTDYNLRIADQYGHTTLSSAWRPSFVTASRARADRKSTR